MGVIRFNSGCVTSAPHSGRIEALLAATKRAGWQERPSPSPASNGSKAMGRGVAVANRSNTMTAAVAEVEVDKTTGKILVKRVVLAHDCGLIVNPDGLTNQIQGNVIQGVSRTLMEEVHFDATGVKNLNWASYPIITFEEAPEVEVVLINRMKWNRSAAASLDCSRPGSDRERCFRRHRSAPARSPLHAGACEERTESLIISNFRFRSTNVEICPRASEKIRLFSYAWGHPSLRRGELQFRCPCAFHESHPRCEI